MMGLEVDNEIPTGTLQAINEQMTGYRQDNPLLPQHVERSTDRIQEHGQAALRLSEKLREFDGIVPLAIDAFYRGDKATRASIDGAGWDQPDIDKIYSTLARIPKYGGEALALADEEIMARSIGVPSQSFEGARNAAIPKPVRPMSLQQSGDGRWMTGDLFFDVVMTIESGVGAKGLGGRADAVSPTGATGLFQFTRGTGKRYGLFDGGVDRRKDPHANFAAMQKLTQDNAAALKRAGIEPTMTNLYLAHQQGAGGAVAIIKAMRNGTEVPANVRTNMNHNNGKGKTPAQFYAMFDEKVRRTAAMAGENYADASGYASMSGGQPHMQQPNITGMMQQVPTQASADVSAAAGIPDYTDPANLVPDDAPKRNESYLAKIDNIFRLEQVSPVPSEVHSAIQGVLRSIWRTI